MTDDEMHGLPSVDDLRAAKQRIRDEAQTASYPGSTWDVWYAAASGLSSSEVMADLKAMQRRLNAIGAFDDTDSGSTA